MSISEFDKAVAELTQNVTPGRSPITAPTPAVSEEAVRAYGAGHADGWDAGWDEAWAEVLLIARHRLGQCPCAHEEEDGVPDA